MSEGIRRKIMPAPNAHELKLRPGLHSSMIKEVFTRQNLLFIALITLLSAALGVGITLRTISLVNSELLSISFQALIFANGILSTTLFASAIWFALKIRKGEMYKSVSATNYWLSAYVIGSITIGVISLIARYISSLMLAGKL